MGDEQIRCKFKCTSVLMTESGCKVTMDAVTADGCPENKKFFQWTPSGHLEMGLINTADALERFIPGDEYFLDFTHCKR